MLTPNRAPKPLATPQQAKDLFKEVGTLTTLKGTSVTDSSSRTFELLGSGAPAEVGTHFPRPAEDAHSCVDSVRITQVFDPSMGRPMQSGSVAWLIFTRHEVAAQRRGNYFTQVVYDILAEPASGNPTYALERHVTAVNDPQETKNGMRSVLAALASPEAFDVFLAEKTAREAALAEARALGLLAVCATEAGQLINFVQELHWPDSVGL